MSLARVVGSANQPEMVEHVIVVPEGAEPLAGFSVTISDGRDIFIVCPSDALPGDKIAVNIPVKASKTKPPTFFETDIPEGIVAGESFPVLLPNGLTVSITCPENTTAGQTLRFQEPEIKSGMQKMLQKAREAVNQKLPKRDDMQSARDKAKDIVSEKANKAKKIMEDKKKLVEGKNPFSKKDRENIVSKAKAKAVDAILPSEIKELKKAKNNIIAPAKLMAHAWDKAGPAQKHTIAAVAVAAFEVPIPSVLVVKTCDAVGTAVKKL